MRHSCRQVFGKGLDTTAFAQVAELRMKATMLSQTRKLKEVNQSVKQCRSALLLQKRASTILE